MSYDNKYRQVTDYRLETFFTKKFYNFFMYT